MTNEKRPKPKIKRRPPGLVITPPAPRPVGEDHPARLLFREAIESAKEPAVGLAAAEPLETAEPRAGAGETAPLPQAHAEPLQIFKELREAATVVEETAVAVVEGPPPAAENTVRRGEDVEETPLADRGNFNEHFGQWKPFLT